MGSAVYLPSSSSSLWCTGAGFLWRSPHGVSAYVQVRPFNKEPCLCLTICVSSATQLHSFCLLSIYWMSVSLLIPYLFVVGEGETSLDILADGAITMAGVSMWDLNTVLPFVLLKKSAILFIVRYRDGPDSFLKTFVFHWKMPVYQHWHCSFRRESFDTFPCVGNPKWLSLSKHLVSTFPKWKASNYCCSHICIFAFHIEIYFNLL